MLTKTYYALKKNNEYFDFVEAYRVEMEYGECNAYWTNCLILDNLINKSSAECAQEQFGGEIIEFDLIERVK